jgi:hypothetical protein
VWLLAAAAVVWALDIAVYGAARFLYAELAAGWDRFGADTPPLSRVFFHVSDVVFVVLGPVAATAPAGLWHARMKRSPRLRRWVHLYFVGGLVAAAWAALALAMWHLTAITPIGRLR